MLLSKLKALNYSSDNSSNEDTPIKFTKEALVTRAELQYSKALQYLFNDQLDRAEDQLSELLQSEIINSLNYTVCKTETARSLLGHLKYCCLTNLGNILFKKSKYPGALINYQEALLIDNSDLNLWFRIGLTHSKLYQTDLAISSFLQGVTCSNSSHWPTLDKLISLLYATNEYVYCLYYISIALKLDANYMKGHFIRNIIFKQFPSLICYFKSYCSNGGLDIKNTELINLCIKQKVLNEIKSVKNNHKLCSGLKFINIKSKPVLFAKHRRLLKNWVILGKWLLQIYDYIFENFEHTYLYEPINFEFDCEFLNQNTTKYYICVDENCCDNFDNQSIKRTVHSTKRKKNPISLTNHLKSRRSSRNKSNFKLNESELLKSISNIIPQYLLLYKNSSDNINSIKWTENSQDTMDLYRLQFSDFENCLKNNLTDEERLKLINDQNYFGTDFELNDIDKFLQLNNGNSISDLLEIFLIKIAHKWSILWPTILVQIYLDVFRRVWIHTEKRIKSHLNVDNLHEIKQEQITDDILCILTYGELLCDNYIQSKINQKPLDGGLIGGDFCSLWISGIEGVLSVLNLNDHMTINTRFLWLRVLFHLQNKEYFLIICNLLNTLLNSISNINDYEIVLPNLEYFYRINMKIVRKVIIALERNNLLNTVKNLYKSKSYPNVVDILKETLKRQNDAEIGIPNYEIMTRKNQYIYMLNSLLELKNYHELFLWSESCLHETVIQYRKSLFEDNDLTQKTNETEFINNIFYAIFKSIQMRGLVIFEILSKDYKSRLINSVINLLSYLIETPDSNSEIDVVSPWLLIYNLLKFEESKDDYELKSSQIDNIPPSLGLLIVSHKYLGKNAWCCFQDGVLLFVTLSEIKRYIHSDLYHTVLVHEVDQIFFCLYKHQIKRNRSRFIQDHKSLGLALTWSRAKQLFQFYKPIELPTFDGKTFTVNSDIQTMLKSVISLVPEEIKPNRLFDNLMAYIREEIDEIAVNNKPLPEDVKDIYYLMADYYFKNKIWGKAIKYYSYDICYNVNRVDSWAGLALAQGSQLEIKLNSCESIKNDYEIIKIAFKAGQCYKHSLHINPGNITLLLEYGLLSYNIHSYCSRLLKQGTSNMNLQMFSEFEKIKENMINTAKKCFETANSAWINDSESQDERWMHYYILGKISEKSEDSSALFIEYYLKAIQFLDSYNAKFPKLIIYADPQYYSIEVLEIYYRIHAGILKLLEKHDNQFNKKLFEQIVKGLDKLSNLSIFDKNKETSKICPDHVKDKIKKDDVNSTKIISDSNSSCDQNNAMEISNIPLKQIKLNNDLPVQEITYLRWKLIQRCLVALQDCIKRFPQHYKSYYRLAYFYFRSPFYKDYDKCRNYMFGECGLFVAKKHNNFFHGIWRIPLSEIDRPGSFAYHMSRSIHLLLDFLKETGDHKMLLDLAIQLKYTPDLDKKYLYDNEREVISTEALSLSIQILKSLYVDHSNKKFFLIQVYKCYKRVLKCWQKKDNNLSKLLLNIFQNIMGTKDDVPVDIIIKYCQKLQMKEKEIDTGHSLCTQKLIPNQIMSSALNNCIPQSIFPLSLETNRESQQKLKKLTKHKLKSYANVNDEQKVEKKRQNVQIAKHPKKFCFKHDNSSVVTFNKSVHNLDSAVEIIKLPVNNEVSCRKYNDFSSQETSIVNTLTNDGDALKITPRIMTMDSHNLKSVCIDLDSKAEQTRIKSSILQNKDWEKKITIPIMSNPGNIFPCAGLSITPIVNANRQINEPPLMSHQIKNIQTKSKDHNFENPQL